MSSQASAEPLPGSTRAQAAHLHDQQARYRPSDRRNLRPATSGPTPAFRPRPANPLRSRPLEPSLPAVSPWEAFGPRPRRLASTVAMGRRPKPFTIPVVAITKAAETVLQVLGVGAKQVAIYVARLTSRKGGPSKLSDGIREHTTPPDR
jgi:hypothetical protein